MLSWKAKAQESVGSPSAEGEEPMLSFTHTTGLY